MLLIFARRSASVLLAALLALTLVPGLTGPADAQVFDDTRGSVYAEAVDALAARDIVLGCTEDDFCPNRAVRRDQLAAMMARALRLPTAGDSGFGDLRGTIHGNDIARVAAAGITVGCASGEFCPADPMTRGQMAAMLDRGFDLLPTGNTYFADSNFHVAAIDRIAANGITTGCGNSITDFCPHDAVLRGQVALFLARSLGLVSRVDLPNLEQREAAAQAEAAVAARTSSTNSRFPDSTWDALARCEAGGNWSINTGNGYYGGLQFSLSSWRAVGGSAYPHQASRVEQIQRGDRLQKLQGWGAWPSCSRQLGLR